MHMYQPQKSQIHLTFLPLPELTGGSSLFPWQKSHSSRREHGFVVWKAVFLLLLMEVQVLRRLYETIYVFNYSPSARMHIFGYLNGLFSILTSRGLLSHLSLCSNCIPEVYHFAASGLAQFIVQRKRHMHDVEISPLDAGSLRVRREQFEEYKIPHGDWFEVVSSPHYLAEIVCFSLVNLQWTNCRLYIVDLWLQVGGEDLTIWLLFRFVVVNLAFAAAETHRWYFRKFDDYAGNRFAIIPYIYIELCDIFKNPCSSTLCVIVIRLLIVNSIS
ncbi:hypothetical protein IC582_001509 [Cucumis melo]